MSEQGSYDLVASSGHIAQVEAESARVQDQIESARARTRRATSLPAPLLPDGRAGFDELFGAAQREIERLDREHRELLNAIRAAAEHEVARLMTAATHQVGEQPISSTTTGRDRP